MAKLLKPMVVVLLILSIISLVLAIMVFNEREILKGRADILVSSVGDIANNLQYTDLNRAALEDYDRMRTPLNQLSVHAELTFQDLMDTRQDLENTRLDLEQTQEELRQAEDRAQRNLERAQAAEQLAEENAAEAARANQQLRTVEGERDSLLSRVDDMEIQIAQMQDEKLELEERIIDQQALIEEYEAEIFAEAGEVGTPEGLRGEIIQVNTDWNFVILNVGSAQGLTTNTEMLVHRGDEMIGRVRVSDVREATAVAEIMPDWSRRSLQRGDNVLF